ncbi:hypothetical protein D3C84_786570 [compost metagenome]
MYSRLAFGLNRVQLEAVTDRSTEPARTVLVLGTVRTPGCRGVVDLYALLPKIGIREIDRDIVHGRPAGTEADNLTVAGRNPGAAIGIVGG